MSSKSSALLPVEQGNVSSPSTTPRRFRIRSSLSVQILLATLIAGLSPLLLISYSALTGFKSASADATQQAVAALDAQAIQAQATRTKEVARSLSGFLEARVNDTLSVRLLPRTAASYLAFYWTHDSDLRIPNGTSSEPGERHVDAPIYTELAYIDARGQERVRIVNGKAVSPEMLRNVREPANTTYKTETYFLDTRALPEGQVYISPVTAWHTSTDLQPAGEPDPKLALGSYYANYNAVIRFGTPIRNQRGEFDGMVLLSVDHRHLMEDVMHIMPVSNNPWTTYPDYQTGNYAYMFDREGYTISHPLLSRIRGLDAEGHLVPYMSAGLSETEMGRRPFNMRYAGWSDPRLPEVFDAVMHQKDDFVITVNRAGAQKASTYAPILVPRAANLPNGIFGGIIIGANTAEFHRAATVIRDHIAGERENQQRTMVEIIALGIILLIGSSVLVARSITQPIQILTTAARAVEVGIPDRMALSKVLQRRVQDEVTGLATVFDNMAREVQLREQRLKDQITDLHIQIDEQKKQEHVAEITDTPYFQDLQQRAKALRTRRGAGGNPSGAAGSDGHE